MNRAFLTVLVLACVSTGACLAAESSAAAKPATAPATSRPATEIVLAKLCDGTVITQDDFNREFYSEMPGRQDDLIKAPLMTAVVNRKLLMRYLKSHPELAPEEKVEAFLAKNVYPSEGVTNRADFEAVVKKKGQQRKAEDFLERVKEKIVEETLIQRGNDLGKDEETLKRMYETRKREFDGSRVKTRQIYLLVAPWDTAEQRQAKLDRLNQMRADILSGKRTWEQCVDESDDPNRTVAGEIGWVPRHIEQAEPLAAAAFELKVGEISPVVTTPVAFHILQATKLDAGTLSFDAVKLWIRLWLEKSLLFQVQLDMHKDCQVVGVREPVIPPPLPMTRPASQPARTAPGLKARPGTTLPSHMPPRPSAASRPARTIRASSRPSR